MSTYHYRDHDFMNQSGQLYYMCECVGWHVWNSEVGFMIPIIKKGVKQEQTTFQESCKMLAGAVKAVCSDYVDISLSSTSEIFRLQNPINAHVFCWHENFILLVSRLIKDLKLFNSGYQKTYFT